jgi:N-acetylglucosaminyldiphosphoundecaprenol N-acetyl-beta-D-mannosaminyltransferase
MTFVVSAHVHATSYVNATKQILDWSKRRESRYVCVANVHLLMEAHDSAQYNHVINDADLVTPDGMPLVWMMRLKGQRGQERVYGPTLMLHVLESSIPDNAIVGFYGSSPEVLQSLHAKMQARFSALKVNYLFSPPFHDISHEEDLEIVRQINASSVTILFVGLGCPKQEKWMADHRGRIQAVMIGVGAAFDFHAGFKPQAPAWMQRLGLEWLFRLSTEPRRLWKRYLYHNPRFVLFAILDLFKSLIK